MKCEMTLEKFKQAVLLVDKTAGRKTTLPVLSCILIDIKKNSATLRSTNLDVGVEVEIPAKSDEAVVFAVPAHLLSSFVSQVDEKEKVICLEQSSGNLNITLSKSHGVLKTIPAEDFPAIPVVTEGKEVEIPSSIFIKGFKSVWYSSAVSNVKPELGSVFIYKSADSAVFVATDSFRLAEKRIPLPKGVAFDDILIPFKNCVEITRVLEAIGPTVVVHSSKNLISFQANGISVVSRVIDGVFPDYKQIIPKGCSTEAIILKQDLLSALKVSTIFSNTFNQVHFNIDPKKKLMRVETKNSDVGENQSDLDAALTGEPVEINFNGKYISDCFQSVDADSLSMQFNGRNKALVIRPVSGDQTFMYLVMPMNR